MALKYDQISRMVISGYKSIKNCDIDFNSINVLIGSNGAGKSNFISAFAFLQSILSNQLQLRVAQSGLNSLLYNGRKITDEIKFEVFFGDNSYGFVLIPTDDNRLIFKQETFGYHGNWEYEGVISTGHSEAKWRNGSRNRTDSYIIPILEKQKWRVYHFHDTGRNARVKQEHNISNNNALMFDASNLAAFLFRLRNNYKHNYKAIVNTIRLIAPFFEDFILEPQEANEELIILKWKQIGCEDVFNASQFSDGTLRFICLTTLLLQPPELQPATIIVDEPELGLHPYAITIFAEMVNKIATQKQIIISTQSVELLNEFSPNDVLVVDRDNNGTRFSRLDEAQLSAWIEDDYALGELWAKNLLGGRP